ncbi:hypothetical protein BZA77DRAFT_305683 [Pyronema omphalodes]|nr:hypothetical protein BZA77DRAFT_305683 [Pyronema omphalodes]
MAYQYLIHSVADPIFAVFIGGSAAVLRIKREEQEAGRDMAQVIEVFKRRVGSYF